MEPYFYQFAGAGGMHVVFTRECPTNVPAGAVIYEEMETVSKSSDAKMTEADKAKLATVKVGDIFKVTHGWDGSYTHIFYQVVKRSSPAAVQVRRIRSRRVEVRPGGLEWTEDPQPGVFEGAEERKLLKVSKEGDVYINDDGTKGWLWTGGVIRGSAR